MYIMQLAAEKEAPSLHATTKFGMKYYTSLDKPPPLQMYAANPSSTRSTADHRGRYFREVTVWIQEVKYSSVTYGADTMTQ